MKALLDKIRKILRDRRTRKLLTRLVSGVAAVVVFITTYALVLPAITMESQAACGIEAHQHDDSCYTEELICGQEETEGHHHTEDCYTVTKDLVCSLEEHQHSAETGCYDEDGNLICKLEEHTHTDSCYEEHRELTCGLKETEGHQHTDSCYKKVLTCGKPVHTHSAACYKADPEIQSAAVASTGMTSAAATSDYSDEEFAQEGFHDGSISSQAFDEPEEIGSEDLNPGEEIIDEDSSSSETEDNQDADTKDENVDKEISDEGISEAETENDPDADLENGNADNDSITAESEDVSQDSNNASEDKKDENADVFETDVTASEKSADKENLNTENDENTDKEGEETASSFSTGFASEENEDSYVPEKEALDFNTVLNNRTGIFYHHLAADETVEDSSALTDWARVDEDTELSPEDLIRVYLSYTLPADSINATNDIARYRLPDTLHLTDEQIDAINSCENGISAQYIDYDNLEITDPERHTAYLGLESVEGTRLPGEELKEDSQEFISAVVRADKIYDAETGEYEGTDLIFTFSPYAVGKNAHAYDKDGQPTRAGEKVTGWLMLDFNLGQVDWADDNTSEIVFAEEDEENHISGIKTVLRQANSSETEADDSAADGATEAAAKYATEEIAVEDTTAEASAIDTTSDVSTADATDEAAAVDSTGEKAGKVATNSVTAETATELSDDKTDQEKQTAAYYPAAIFNDSITVLSGRLDTDLADTDLPRKTKMTVRVEAAEGTFPEGTKMVLSAVEDLNAVAEAVGTAIDIKTRGFQAVDITFYDKDPSAEDAKEIEPLKPIRVSIKSDEIRKAAEDASTAPVVVHIEDDNTATEIENTASKTDSAMIEIEKPGLEKGSIPSDSKMTDTDSTVQEKDDSKDTNATDTDADTTDAATIEDQIIEDQDGETDEAVPDLNTTDDDDVSSALKEDNSNDINIDADTADTALMRDQNEETHNVALEQNVTKASEDSSVEKGDNVTVEINQEDSVVDNADVETNNASSEQDAATAESNAENIPTTTDAEAVDTVTDKESPEESISQIENNSNAKRTDDSVNFEADSFSVYAIVYTVDFHWEINGKVYDFSIPGGGFVSLEHVVEVLGIANTDSHSEKSSESVENEAENTIQDEVEESDINNTTTYSAVDLNAMEISEETRKFVADVESVEFSNPELVWVGKVEQAATVGEIKSANGLECQYSANLTEELIAEINSSTVEVGDWALISVQPFTSEESLTVTMNNGDQFVVKVTDAMDSTVPYSKGTTFTAYDTRLDGFTINLFDYGPESDLDHGDNNLKDKGDQYNSGINNNHTLKFTAFGKKPSEVPTNNQNVLSWNHFSGTDAATQGIVDKNLSGGYPKLNGGESLAYLFNTTSDGNNKKVYTNVSGLFQKDADGKYYYNSNVNYAYYNPNQGNGGNFQLCDTFPEEGSDWGVGFFPFNEWNGSKNCIHWNGYCPATQGSNAGRYYYNHHFGMTLEGSFQLTPDGKLNNKDLVFNFSGDDDLWVFIDDVLVLDIGGIHNPVGGSINFRTGDVKVNSAYPVNTVINDSQSGPEVHTTIAQAFANAGKTWNSEPYAEHTIKVFYMERGGCYSNCQMEFNLTRFKDVEFDKKDQYGDPVENAEFRLFKEDGSPLIETYVDHDDNDTIKYREYVRYSDATGHIKFDHIPVGTYYIRETTVPEGYIRDEATYTAKVVVERNDNGTYSVHSYVLRNGTQTEQVLNTKQKDINLSLDKKWKIGDTEVTPSAATASFQLMRVKIVEETHTEPGTKIPAVVKLQDKNGTSLCSDLNVHVGDTIKISDYLLNVDNYPWDATDTIVTASGTEIGTLHSWNYYGNKQSEGPIYYTVQESDVENGKVILKTRGKAYGEFSTRPKMSLESEGPDPDPVTVTTETTDTEAVETFDLPDGGSWSKSFKKPLYDEHGRKYTYYFVETSNSEGTAPIYVDGNGQVISDPSTLATDKDNTQSIINKIENGSIEITKTLQKNGNPSSLTGTFYFAVYAEADVENGVPKDNAQPIRTGSITVGERDNGVHAETIRVPIGTYYVYELTGKGGTPIVETSRQRIGERTYQVTGSGTRTEVGVTDGTAAFNNNYETVSKTATKSWSDNTDHPTIYFKLFYVSHGVDAEHGHVIEFVEAEDAEIKELANGMTSVTWGDLPKYDANGEEYTYIVKEYIKNGGEYVAAAPEGYVKSENGLTVNNTKSEGYDPKTTYEGTKTWEDTANNGATRPDSLHVDLYANGVKQEDRVAQWSKGTGNAANVWTYTFSDLPVFDENGVYIKYTAVETPVAGYNQGETNQQATSYQVISGSVDENIERVTTCSSVDITLAEETDLAYVVIKKSAKGHLVWTQRPISQPEKNKIYEDINEVSGFVGELNNSTVDFVSGLPVETEFFKGTVTASKTSDKVMHIEFANHQTWAQLCYGSYRYSYDPGRTDFINSLVTTEVEATKAWQDSTGHEMTPPEGTTATFDLYANGVQQNKPVILNGKVDVTELSDDPEIAKTQEVNAEAVAAGAYEKEAWKAYWGNLPTHNAIGEAITYTVKETNVPGYENLNPDGTSSGGIITNKQIVIDIHILKVGEDDQPITGAAFKLDQYDDTRKNVIKSWGPNTVSTETGKEGTLTFESLGIGKYTLVETETPEGYVKVGDDPQFEVIAGENGELQVQFTSADSTTYDPATKTFTVHNTPGAALPNTGGSGTTALYLIGFILTAFAGAGFVMKRRRRNAA